MKLFYKILILSVILLNFSLAETVDPVKELNNQINKLEKNIGKSIKALSKKSLNKKDTKKFKEGDVLMASSWSSPATNKARASIFDNTVNTVQWTGPRYLF